MTAKLSVAMIQSATLHITPEVLGLIAELDEFKRVWRALGRLARYPENGDAEQSATTKGETLYSNLAYL